MKAKHDSRSPLEQQLSYFAPAFSGIRAGRRWRSLLRILVSQLSWVLRNYRDVNLFSTIT